VNPYSRSAPATFFFWNKALAAQCEASPKVMVDDGNELPAGDYEAAIAAGARSFYVVTTLLGRFAQQVLPLIKVPFVVVSGSSDFGGPLGGAGSGQCSHCER
jgi:ABC-type methionine transport system permease subunit